MSIHINRFLDRVRTAESKGQRDVLLPLSEARDLHSEITRLLSRLENITAAVQSPPPVEIEIKGGSF